MIATLMRFKYWLMLCLLFISHHHGQNIFSRELINHDDRTLIRPILESSFSNYFENLIWNRDLYTYPVKDMIYWSEAQISSILGLSIYWLNQYLFFCLFAWTLYIFLSQFNFLNENPMHRFALWSLSVAHPLNVEVVDWLSSRKQIYMGICAFWILIFYLRAKKNKEPNSNLKSMSEFQWNLPLSTKCWSRIIFIWLISLACFPTIILLLPALILFDFIQTKDKKMFIPALICLCISLPYMFWATADSNSYAPGLRDILDPNNWNRVGFFFVAALGRGFFNLLFPIKLFPYYSEISYLNWIGLGLLIGTIIITIPHLPKPRSKSNKHDINITRRPNKTTIFSISALITRFFGFATTTSQMGAQSKKTHKKTEDYPDYSNLLILLLVVPISMLIPSGMVFLTYSEFVWADRYLFGIFPLIFLIFYICFKSYLNQNKIVGMLASILVLIYLGMVFQRSPLWINASLVMKDCAIIENSAKCVNSYLHKSFFEKSCESPEVISLGAKLHRENLYKFNLPFAFDMPFFHSTCVAIDKHVTPEEKIPQIAKLFDMYKGSPSIIFSLVLVQLQNGDIQSAYESLKNSFLSEAHSKLPLSGNILGVVAGQIDAICELTQNPQCFEQRKYFESELAELRSHPGYRQWGYLTTINAAVKKP